MKKVFLLLILFITVGFSGIFLTGCQGTQSTLEKGHIMNGGCFITCRNNKPKAASSGKLSYNKKSHNHNYME